MRKKYDIIFVTTCINHNYIYKLIDSINYSNNDTIDLFVIIINQTSDNINYSCDNTKLKRNSFKIIDTKCKLNSSEARNIGLRYIFDNGIISSFVCFPDDDSSFDENFFIEMKSRIVKKVTTCFVTDVYCTNTNVLYRKVNKKNNSYLTKKAYSIVGAVNIVLLYEVVKKIGLFDERFGVNAMYGAGEDGDYFIRALEVSEFIYSKDIYSYHPANISKFNDLDFRKKIIRLRNYGIGVIAFLNKHKLYYYSIIVIFRGLVGFFVSLLRLRVSLAMAYLYAFFVRIFYFVKFLVNPVR